MIPGAVPHKSSRKPSRPRGPKSAYGEKLLDPRWQKRRLQILERDGFACQSCADTKTTLHVHHRWYEGEPWEAPDDALVTLCEPCHQGESEWRRDAEERIIRALRRHFFCGDLEPLAYGLEAIKPVRIANFRSTTPPDVMSVVAQALGSLMARTDWLAEWTNEYCNRVAAREHEG